MNGRERVQAVLAGDKVDRLPVLPILHSALASLAGVPLGSYLGDAAVMARVTLAGYHDLELDGVQLSQGVTAEAEALGADIVQPPDGIPSIRAPLLTGLDPSELRKRDATRGGRIPVYMSALRQVTSAIGEEAFVLATLRGPLVLATQLHGIAETLIDLLENPSGVADLLDYCTELALSLGQWLLTSGAHGLVLGEATCSPAFISPALYRQLVQPRQRWLVEQLHHAGWQAVGLHICGDITPILPDIVATGVDFLDVDYAVPVARALELASGHCALRGNLDPSSDLYLGNPAEIRRETTELLNAAKWQRWIVSSGCDIPPGTPRANLLALTDAVHVSAQAEG